MEDLNAVSSQYRPNAATEIENDLVLHSYPKRILSRFYFADALLETGLDHGFIVNLFERLGASPAISKGNGLEMIHRAGTAPNFGPMDIK